MFVWCVLDPDKALLLVQTKSLNLLYIDGSSVGIRYEEIHVLHPIEKAVAGDIDAQTQSVYWSDATLRRITRAALDGSGGCFFMSILCHVCRSSLAQTNR